MPTLERVELNVAKEFSDTPGPRKREEGDYSGEAFLEELLRPRFQEALNKRVPLHVNLDGAAGYLTSFLQASFGGLAREFGVGVVDKNLQLTAHDEPYLEEEIRKYIREA